MTNVISFKKWNVNTPSFQSPETLDPAFRSYVSGMDRLELLKEMVKFQEERNQLGYLTETMMIQGQILFGAIEKVAETLELKTLAHSYCRHLKYELEVLQKAAE